MKFLKNKQETQNFNVQKSENYKKHDILTS